MSNNFRINITKSNTLYLPTKYYPLFEEIVLPYMQKELLYKINGHVIS